MVDLKWRRLNSSPFLLQTDIFPVLYSASFPLNLFVLHHASLFAASLSLLSVGSFVWAGLTGCWSRSDPSCFNDIIQEIRKLLVESRRIALYFTLFVSTLLRFNFNNLIYIMIISASCLYELVQDIKSAHPAAIKTNAELIPSYCSNRSTFCIHLPTKEVWYWGKRVLIMCNVNGCWWMTDLFGTNN